MHRCQETGSQIALTVNHFELIFNQKCFMPNFSINNKFSAKLSNKNLLKINHFNLELINNGLMINGKKQ